HCAFAAPLAPEALERARTLGCVACARHRAGALDLALLARGQRAVGVDRIRVAPQPEKSLRALSLPTRAGAAREAARQRAVGGGGGGFVVMALEQLVRAIARGQRRAQRVPELALELREQRVGLLGRRQIRAARPDREQALGRAFAQPTAQVRLRDREIEFGE